MITAADIHNAKFERVRRGYDMTEVDNLLDKVADTLEAMTRERDELAKKLEVLAKRIQEYRQDEDSIRSALLTAQKSADQILREAEEEKERLLADAHRQAEDSVRLSQEKSVSIANETRDKVAQVLGEAKEKAAHILTEAKEKAERLKTETTDHYQAEKRYLGLLRESEEQFRQQLLELYKQQFELLKKGPEAVRLLEASLKKQPEPATLRTPPAAPAKPAEPAAEAEKAPAFMGPEDLPLPVAEKPAAKKEAEDTPIQNGFSVQPPAPAKAEETADRQAATL